MGRRVFSVLVPLLALALTVGACGKEIGDSCSFATDCDPNGQRICIDPTAGHGGYCTIQGCDYSTCPDESACVRFFTGTFANKTCAPETEAMTPQCSPDELCSIQNDVADPKQGHCVPRASETRFCMRKCDSNDDCRDGYECRTFALMQQHGGEPVLAPGVLVTEETAPKFCAVAPAK
ncbi:MAG TPA: hypothetical protein VFP84_16725 [Kofleriaceae bacterium]|nr:hypothetical protein [Kofleriaceae bacterium]